MNADITLLFIIATFFIILVSWWFLLRPAIIEYTSLLLQNQKLKLMSFVQKNGINRDDVAYKNILALIDSRVKNLKKLSFLSFIIFHKCMKYEGVNLKEIKKIHDLDFQTPNKLLSDEIEKTRFNCTNILSTYMLFSGLISMFITVNILLVLIVIGLFVGVLKKAFSKTYLKHFFNYNFTKVVKFATDKGCQILN